MYACAEGKNGGISESQYLSLFAELYTLGDSNINLLFKKILGYIIRDHLR